MLDFYLKENGKLITELSLNDIIWLSKFKVIKEGRTGLLKEDGVETLPFFDDYELSYNNALVMNDYSQKAIFKLLSTSGFKSDALDKFNLIINTIITTKKTIKVICD